MPLCVHCGKTFSTVEKLEAHLKKPRCSLCGHTSNKLYGTDRMCKRCYRGFQDYISSTKI